MAATLVEYTTTGDDEEALAWTLVAVRTDHPSLVGPKPFERRLAVVVNHCRQLDD